VADIELRIGGDSSGARNALEAVEDAWSDYGDAVKKATELAVKFAVDAVKEWQKAERVSRQLERAAGDFSKELEAQAEALSKVLGVDDDLIKQQQTLLAQWGGAGAATQEVTKAVLDYAAATGQDAVAATQSFIQQVETGGGGLRKLGVDFKATGDKGKDLAAAVAAISAKFGGAAGAESDALNKQLVLADQAVGDLKESFGKVVAEFVTGTGVIASLTDAVRGFQLFAFGDPADEKRQKLEKLFDQQVDAARRLTDARKALEEATKSPDVSLSVAEMFADDVAEAQKRVNDLRRSIQDLMGGAQGGAPALPAVTGLTAAGKAQAEKAAADMQALREKNLADFRKYLKDEEAADVDAAAKAEDRRQRELEALWKNVDEQEKARQAEEEVLWESRRRMAKIEDDYRAREAEEKQKALDDAAKAAAERLRRESERSKAAADAIGAAFVNGLTEQLSRLAAGEEMDPAMFVGEMLANVLQTAAGVLATVFPGFGAIIGAVGNLAAMGVRAGSRAISGGGKRKKMHAGGFVEPERYHNGLMGSPGEVPAILQEGEAVLSRANVAAMGGRQGVERAKRGGVGGGFVVNVSALDAKSAAESFVSGVDRGLKNALRSGQGFLPQLLPNGVR